MKSDVLQVASAFIAMVRASGIPIDAAYVFGSQATGKAKPYSDIDVCVWCLRYLGRIR